MDLYELTLQRFTERGALKEWHRDTDGTLYVQTYDNTNLTIPAEHFVFFVLGMWAGEVQS
jgi:hypothetical protein